MRLAASQPPRSAPYRSIASSAYREHEGVKRHDGGNAGEMNRWYPRMHRMAPRRGHVAISSPSLLAPGRDIIVQSLVRRIITRRPRTEYYVPRREPGPGFTSPDLPQLTAQAIASNSGPAELRHDHAEAGETRLVVGPENVDVGPVLAMAGGEHAAKVCGVNQPAGAREALVAVRCGRASSRGKPSGASDPFSGGATGRHGPSGRPSACGIHAWRSVACCADDTSASLQ